MSKNSTYSPPIHCGDHVYIQPTYFIIKPDFINSNARYTGRQKANEENLKDNKNKGKLSIKSSSKMRNSLNWLISAAKYKAVYVKSLRKNMWFKVSFLTLTIPPQNNQTVDSRKFQKCLNTFLVYSRKYYQLHNYVWKIEASSDGRLHVHLTLDIFYHYKDARNCWNRILQKENLLEDHYKKFGDYNPNSTDIHSVRNVENLSGYICKYMDKKPNLPETFNGRVWGCSYSLSSKNKCYCYLDNDTEKTNIKFVDRPMIRYKQIQSKPDAMGNTKSVASMYMLYGNQWETEMEGLIKDTYNNHRQRIRDNTPKQPKEYLTIDFFGEKSKGNYEFINLDQPKKEKCEIENNTVRSGQIQYDLGF